MGPAILRDLIKKEGQGINRRFCTGEVDGHAYIDACLHLYDRWTDRSLTFENAQTEGYAAFLNETLRPVEGEASGRKVRTSQLLSAYCDSLMTNDKLDPDELGSKLHKIVHLFSHISDKDLFRELYRTQMSKRLLLLPDWSGANDCNERQLITKLKVMMGPLYTSKLEGMLYDKGLSAENQEDFLNYCRAQDIELKTGFSAQVLTAGFWPAFKIGTLNPPDILSTHMEFFRQFYCHKLQSRVLTWVHSLGTAIITCKFKKGEMELTVSTHQACVLGLFNTKGAITVREIGKELALPLDEIKRTVHSLVFGKFALLQRGRRTREMKNQQITKDDEFEVNEDFTHRTRKFRVPDAIKTVGDPLETTDKSRQHMIECCIVRVMKSRKQLSHLDLQTECTRQLSNHFRPGTQATKRHVEGLIRRGYLERVEGDRNLYRYLA